MLRLIKQSLQQEFPEILITEGVTDLDILDTYVKATYPDLRKCINTVQMNVQDNSLLRPNEGDTGEADWKLEMVELFKAGKINDARKLLCGAVQKKWKKFIVGYMTTLNCSEMKKSKIQQSPTIKQGLVDLTLVADPEINLAATLIRLARL